MNFHFAIGIAAVVLAVINGVVLIYGMVKGKVHILAGLVIVFLAAVVPYGLALLAVGLSNRDLGKGLNTWMVSGLLLMLVTGIYLLYQFRSKRSLTEEESKY